MRTIHLRSSVVAHAIVLGGCCFGDFARGVSDGVALQTECAAVIQSANAVNARVEALPDSLADVAEPTPEQVAASLEPFALAYEQSANELSAIPVTNAELLAHRDALVRLNRDAAQTMRAQGAAMAAAMRVGDEAAIDAAGASGEPLIAREDAIIGELNRVCSR